MRSEGETEPSSISGFKEKEQKEQLPPWSHRVELRTRWTWEMKPPASMTSFSELGQAAPVGPRSASGSPGCSGAEPSALHRCCLVKLWLTRGAAVCQRLSSVSPPLLLLLPVAASGRGDQNLSGLG